MAPPSSSSSSSTSDSTCLLVPYTNEFHRVTVRSPFLLHLSLVSSAFPFPVTMSSNPPLPSDNQQTAIHILVYWSLS